MSAPTLIIIHETVLQSWLMNAGSFVTFAAMLGPGVWLESPAMQWVAAIMWFLLIIGIAVDRRDGMSVEQARQRLDEIEREAGR